MIAVIPLAAGVFVAGAAQTAHAQTQQAPTDANASCAITSDDLATVTAAEAQGLLVELAARRALLTRTITCAKTEATTLQNNLNELSVSGDAKTIQSQLSGKLDDAANYYDLELGKVSGAGIAGTQAIAKEVLAWRASNYDPLAAQVADFTLWTGNQNLFATATARLRSIESIVSFVLQAGQNGNLQNDLGNAQSLMQTANNENAAAENALLQSLPPDQTLALIQQSLQSLSAAYQKFFDISTIVQTLLPTAKGGQ